MPSATLSIVVPLFNEAESIAALYAELSDVARRNSYEVEILFIDDGSTDGSWAAVRQLASQDRASAEFVFAAILAKRPL